MEREDMAKRKNRKSKKGVKVRHCPFAHEEGKAGTIKVVFNEGAYQVFCQFCGALGPKAPTPEDAVLAWHERTMTVVSQEQLDTLKEEMDKDGGK